MSQSGATSQVSEMGTSWRDFCTLMCCEMDKGRYHYPGYRYYEYPHYVIRIYGGGTYYYAPGYHYPRRPQP